VADRDVPGSDLATFERVIADDARCDRCFSALSAIVVALDAQGRVTYGNTAFDAEVSAAWDIARGPRPLAEVWPGVAAVLPDISILSGDPFQHCTHVREVQLDPGSDEPRDHLVFLDPVPGCDGGASLGWVLTLVDIAHIRRAERSSRDNLKLEMFLSRISARFVGTTEIDDAIAASLEDIAQVTACDRAFFCHWREDVPGVEDFIVWQNDAIASPSGVLQANSAALRAWYESLLAGNETVQIDDLASEVPADIRSVVQDSGDSLEGCLLVVPIAIDARITGVVGVRYIRPGSTPTSASWVALDIFCYTLERVIQLKRSQEALEATNKQLQEKSAQLVHSEKMASIGQMAAGVAHEINNPVGFIMSNLSTLQDYTGNLKAAIAICRELAAKPDSLAPELQEAVASLDIEDLDFVDEDIDDLLRESLEGCERVRDIVQNLKGFARGDDTEARTTDLNDCIESTLKIVWNELKYRCEVVKEYGDLPAITCFPGKINQVIMNLLVNGAQAIAEKGTITLRTYHDDDRVYLAVSDTGSGIPEDVQARLFDPFFTTKEPGKGTGLGLYICHNIVEEHGGEISLESTVGQGTTFTVALPRQTSSIEQEGDDLVLA